MQTGMCCCCVGTIPWFSTGLGITRGWLASQTTGRLYVMQRVSRKTQALKALLQNPTQVNSPARLQLHVFQAVAQQTMRANAVPARTLRNRGCSTMSSNTCYVTQEPVYIVHQQCCQTMQMYNARSQTTSRSRTRGQDHTCGKTP